MAESSDFFDRIAAEMGARSAERVPEDSAFRRESAVRLIDAAVVVARAAGAFARVAEEILVEQRERLQQPAPHAGDESADARPPAAATRIDLTY